jgi:pimeloyl-ACP methyl ester carboxylesterase
VFEVPRGGQAKIATDFGGSGAVVHLAHANGFPPGTYRPLAELLTERYHVLGLPSRPMWPHSRPESAPTWRPLAGDLIQGLEELGLGNVCGLGHSLGAVLTMWAAIERPDLFRAVVLVEPVILPPAWLLGLRIARRLGFERRMPMVQAALHRHRIWPSREAAFGHYRAKPLFCRWPDDSLWAYVESGLVARDDGQLELAYPPEWEAHIFASTPTGIWKDVPELRVPTLLVGGELSSIFRPESLRRASRLLPQAQAVTIAGSGHMTPMERPVETSAPIMDFLSTVM